jgi:uncharacterized membrane protein YeaQ/YmgE (transglycosylase-associated protein family)
VRGAGFGLIGNIVIGIIGALVAGWLLPQLGVSLGSGTMRDIINATIGAVVVLVICRWSGAPDAFPLFPQRMLF